MFFKSKVFQQSYIHVSLCLAFLFSGSVIGCLQEENPSPLERKLQEFVVGSSNWIQNVSSNEQIEESFTSKVKLSNGAENERYQEFIELIPLHQD
jgi:hypothetical protein